MVYSEYTKRRILFHQEVGLGVTGIVSVLKEEEGINVTKSGVSQFLKRHAKSRSLLRAGRSSIITKES